MLKWCSNCQECAKIQITKVQSCLDLRATQLNKAAEGLPHGDEREALLHKANRAEVASFIIDRWLSSPGVRELR
jgi:hypothetical protein